MVIAFFLFLFGFYQYSLYQAPNKQLEKLSEFDIKKVIYQKALHNGGFGCTYLMVEYSNSINLSNNDSRFWKKTPVQQWTIYGEYPFEKCIQDFSHEHQNIINHALNHSNSWYWNFGDSSEPALLVIPDKKIALHVRYGD